MRHVRQLADIMLPEASSRMGPSAARRNGPRACRRDYKPGMDGHSADRRILNQRFKTGTADRPERPFALSTFCSTGRFSDYIVNNKRYSRTEQNRNSALKIDFPAGQIPLILAW